MSKKAFYQQLLHTHGSPLFIVNTKTIQDNYRHLQSLLPKTRLYFAIKAFPHPEVIKALSTENAYFDLASVGELELIQKENIATNKTIYTHPIKTIADIKTIIASGCNTFVVDNIDEIIKFQSIDTPVQLLLRIAFENTSAQCNLSKKFGCQVKDVIALLAQSKKINQPITGLCFHVGSQTPTSIYHTQAIKTCEHIIESVKELDLPNIEILDIGGGFPASPNNVEMTDYCRPIQEALNLISPDVQIYAEPGRYITANSTTHLSTIVGKHKKNNTFWYFLDDGIYHAFSGKIFDGFDYPFQIFHHSSAHHHLTTIAGPTCDSIDIIHENLLLPELSIGDLFISSLMGAYTWANSTEFNSIQKTKVIAI